MKRSVAILGRTPQFVRWAIWQECSLRQLSADRLTHETFRSLRGLREFSVARSEGRVIDGVCIHPTASSAQVSQAKGFFDSEVLDAHGDEDFVNSCCSGCLANSLQDLWCGCYGWLFSRCNYRFDTTTEASEESDRNAEEEQGLDFVELVDQIIEENNLSDQAARLFAKASPRWYGIWKAGIVRDEKAEWLLRVFALVEQRVEQQGVPRNPDLAQLIEALKRCCEHGLAIHVELVPPGFSDGQTWTISRCCPTCKFEMQDKKEQSCPACKRFGNPHELRKNKVLGLRPYVHLEGVIGAEKTAEILKKFEA